MLRLVLILTTLSCFSSYTITFDFEPSFPIIASHSDDNSFIRKYKNKIEVLTCPESFVYDAAELKCVFENVQNKPNEVEMVTCPHDYAGTLTNTKNCRTFIDCWYGIGYIMSCNVHLLFNNVTKECDWPDKADCCEFWENDISKLVVDM
ncbi:hypothetical protein FQA39_LY13608 [Lamprigera yunnana]|nr:hypothetical protein FQA39_LY13608 [Lamprigera yunnana]